MSNYGLTKKYTPVTHIITENKQEYIICETNRTLQVDGTYVIDFYLYELHNGKADKLLGKGHNPLILEKKYIKT